MPNTAQVNFSVLDLSFSVANVLKGISCVEGVTKRGPFANAELLITTWAQFTRVYGGYITNSDFPLLCKRAFDRGAQLRVNRVGHYTDITDKDSLDAITASVSPIAKVELDDDFVTGNSVVITINGTSLPAVAFNTDSDTTADDIVAATLNGFPTLVQDVILEPLAPGYNLSIIPISNTVIDTGTPIIVTTGGASQPVATNSEVTGIVDVTGTVLFEVNIKYPGLDYNQITVTIGPASNGNTNYFNLYINHLEDSQLNEVYSNLTIVGTPTVADSHYLDTAKLASQLVNFVYADLSALTGPLRPFDYSYYYGGGSDGTAPVLADYIGDSVAGNGFRVFDVVDDAYQFCAPELSNATLHIAGAAYIETRKDMMYLAHLDNGLTTAAAYIAERDGTLINSYYVQFFGGGLVISDPVTGAEKQISELGDILGIINYSDNQGGPWLSYAGVNRGFITNALKVVNNFGPPAKFNDLNQLANHQINMVVVKNNQLYLSGNFSGVIANSKLSFVNVVRTLLFIQKSIRPTLERYLEEPNDIPTFKRLFREVEPFFNQMVVDGALYSYRWDGDQNITKIEDVVVNTPTGIDNGIYKVKLFLKIVATMNEIEVQMVIAPTGVSFDTL